MLQYKSFEQIASGIIDRLKERTPLTDFTPGSITRALVDIFSGEISTLYHVIDINLRQTHPSTAAGRYLDLIGQMLGVLRRENETDENYLYRIAHRWDEAATSNEMAVRLAALAVPGVRDVQMRPYVLGSGSFSVYPVLEPGVHQETVISQVRAAVDKACGYGTRFIVELGEELVVSLVLEVRFDPLINPARRTELIAKAKDAVGSYIESLGLGDRLVLAEIHHRVMDLSDDKEIRDVRVVRMTVDGAQTLVDNLDAEWDERFVPGAISVQAM